MLSRRHTQGVARGMRQYEYSGSFSRIRSYELMAFGQRREDRDLSIPRPRLAVKRGESRYDLVRDSESGGLVWKMRDNSEKD